MQLFASFNGPSGWTMLVAIATAAVFSAVLGFFVKRLFAAFLGGALGAGLITYFVVAHDQGDMVQLIAMIVTPVFSLGGGIIALIAAAVGKKSSSEL